MRADDAHGFGGAHDATKPTVMLSEEHRIIERVLDVVESLTRLPAGESLDRWKKALEFFRHFADQCHHHKEEKVLFPAMESHGIPRDGGPIGMMLQEHEEGRAHIRAMVSAVEELEKGNAKAAESLLRHGHAYMAMLREHIQKEDEILFKMADEVIPEEEQRQLARKFEEHEAEEIGAGVHDRYLKLVAELESSATT